MKNLNKLIILLPLFSIVVLLFSTCASTKAIGKDNIVITEKVTKEFLASGRTALNKYKDKRLEVSAGVFEIASTVNSRDGANIISAITLKDGDRYFTFYFNNPILARNLPQKGYKLTIEGSCSDFSKKVSAGKDYDWCSFTLNRSKIIKE